MAFEQNGDGVIHEFGIFDVATTLREGEAETLFDGFPEDIECFQRIAIRCLRSYMGEYADKFYVRRNVTLKGMDLYTPNRFVQDNLSISWNVVGGEYSDKITGSVFHRGNDRLYTYAFEESFNPEDVWGDVAFDIFMKEEDMTPTLDAPEYYTDL